MSEIDLQSYDKYIVAFSGGKDSIASFLTLLEAGVPTDRIELWHHLVDGREEGKGFMDWKSTEAYCKRFAAAFNVPIYFSWKEGGFKREMLRNKTETARTWFETPEGLETAGGNSGKFGTRLLFPQASPDLSVRWCSAYLKVDICSTSIRNQDRFNFHRTLLVTGERAQESTARAKYATFEPDRADGRDGRNKRLVDHYRPVHALSEKGVWALIEKYRINVAPPYRLGWGRLSCAKCIFGNRDQWASAAVVDPEGVLEIAELEAQFGKTIDRKAAVLDKLASGTAYGSISAALIAEANNESWDGPIVLPEGTWTLPAGAFKECGGPV